MKCDCGAMLRVAHTYTVQQHRIQDLACPECLARYTLQSTLIKRAGNYGDGAFAVASRIRREASEEKSSGS